jgi:hypothetical protein
VPTSNQILGARIRAEQERYWAQHRKPYMGGYTGPSREVTLAHLSRVFGLTPHEVSGHLTYSRQCTHPWSDGACEQCP